jgi:hypothetical protein
MKKLLLLLIVLLVVPSFGEESAPKQRRRSSFYFDATVGVALRYLWADQIVRETSGAGTGCHFEPDGRYVCNKKSLSGKPVADEKKISYMGFGPLFSVRFGCLIKGVFAIFANLELEQPDGSVYGREEDYKVRPRSSFLGGGPGVAFYPFRHSANATKNIYIVGAVNLFVGDGGGIDSFGPGFMIETGYLYPVLEQLNLGFAAGADILANGAFDSDIKRQSGYGVWVGLKFVKK